MSDVFRIYTGLELDEASRFITGEGVPGSSTNSNDAQRGSFYTNTLDGGFFVKVSQGSGVDKWQKLATENFVGSATSTGISWREPVNVVDTTHTNTASLIGDLDADDEIQGVSVISGMRILAASVTGNRNVFIVSGSTGAWTLTEDTNSETAGDTVYVISGDEAGKTYQYDGTDWQWIKGAENE